MKCIEKNPAARFPSVAELLAALDRMRGGYETVAVRRVAVA
jgi:hypothetical protein